MENELEEKLAKATALDAVLAYILEHEEKDWYENPSKHHVYYAATIAKYGTKSADLELRDARVALALKDEE